MGCLGLCRPFSARCSRIALDTWTRPWLLLGHKDAEVINLLSDHLQSPPGVSSYNVEPQAYRAIPDVVCGLRR